MISSQSANIEESPSKSGAIQAVSIVGTGSYLPERIVTNAELEKSVDTTDEWIVTRTGIKERRIAADDQATSDLGAAAARKALADAQIVPDDVDVIVTATLSPDRPFPNTGCAIQANIGAKNAFCFSIEAACSGFLYALEIARQFVATGQVKTALVVACEKMSSVVDWEDRTTCVLFGDGAGAVVLRASDSNGGLQCSVLKSDGTLADLLMVPAGGSRLPASAETVRDHLHYLKMEGREVYRHAVTCMVGAARDALHRCGLQVDDVACVIPHQANSRIIHAVAKRLKIPLDRFIINLDKYGNTSGASVAIALDEAAHSKAIKQGDFVLIIAFGGGFTWGASVIKWDKA